MNNDFTPTRIAADREIINAATRGPWKREQSIGGEYAISTPDFGVRDYCFMAVGLEREADAAFIAAARTGWPAALDEIERLQKRLERSVELLCEVGDTVYEPYDGRIFTWPFHGASVELHVGGGVRMMDDLGKTVFLTREEAEAALQKGATL